MGMDSDNVQGDAKSGPLTIGKLLMEGSMEYSAPRDPGSSTQEEMQIDFDEVDFSPARSSAPSSPSQSPLRRGSSKLVAMTSMLSEVSGMTRVSLRSEQSVSGSKGRLEDHYTMTKLLGKGGFGTVSLATCLKTGEARAVKSLPCSDAESFVAEFSIAKRLKHPNLVRIYDMFETGETSYLVMDLCSGGDLISFIGKRESREFGAVMYATPDATIVAVILWQTLKGIWYLHGHNIAHRDIKNDNILFEGDSEYSRVKIIDFGLSTNYKKGKPIEGVVGTRGFICPEAISGIGYNELCDVWSVGVVAFVLFVGRFAFDIGKDATSADELKAMNETEIDWTYNWGKHPKEAKELVQLMMTLDPKSRPSAKALLSKNAWLRLEGRKSEPQCCCSVS